MKKDKNTQEHKNKETFSNETENKNGAKIANQKLFRQKGFITKMKKTNKKQASTLVYVVSNRKPVYLI